MKYIIGLSGTHGTGKSTILQGVKAAGFKMDESQLSRTAQKNLGWSSLSIVEESVDNMWALQDAIIHALEERDLKIQISEQYTLVERTPADLWAYTSLWCHRLGIDEQTDERAVTYKMRCHELAQKYYARVMVVTPNAAIPFVAEPNRADIASRKHVELCIDSFLFRGNHPTYFISSVSKEQRIAEACSIMRAPLITPGKGATVL